MKWFSDRKRPMHLGPYPTERLHRVDRVDLSAIVPEERLSFAAPDDPTNILNAMRDYQAMMDAIRDGLVNKTKSDIPDASTERSNHIKSFGYFCDASMVGICRLGAESQLDHPRRNPDIDRLAAELKSRQTETLASGIDVVMADLKEAIEAAPTGANTHKYAIVFIYENPRAPRTDEVGTDWLQSALAARGALRANETACVIGNYIRLLGWDAKSHSMSASDVSLTRLAVAAGLARATAKGGIEAPWLGTNFGLAAVTTDMELSCDRPLSTDRLGEGGLAWQLGARSQKSARNRDPFAGRDFVLGPHPFERLRRVEQPTTFIDEARVPRVPKRTDMFARALFGDMGKPLQDRAKGGHYVRKSAPSFAQRRALGAFVLLQNGPGAADGPRPTDAARNAANIKATAYFLGADAVGISRCPDWVWYSHNAVGEPITPPHDQAISMVIDQGYETMEGSSGDDWIAVAQSMRAYLRFSLLGGVLAQQIRNLGYEAKAHTVMDGDVLQPPLLLLAGLGEVSRIGEVILNPYLGPRLKSGVVTTDMPLAHDQPIDFGLQNFCESCNKCARECPSGAITAGPKLMFNGYEIWKSDSQKCATYRISTEGGAMCGRCMKTCPWNLEGLFAEAPFRWMASNRPQYARSLAWLDDKLGNGGLNPVKKWWWDLELHDDGGYRPARQPVNQRDLQPELKLTPEDQTLAVYPAPLAPPPWPYPFPMDREAGIAAYDAMIPAAQYQDQLAHGTLEVSHIYHPPDEAPVLRVEVANATEHAPGLVHYELRALDGGDLPLWHAGAHIDVVVAPEYLRQYSLCGDPGDRSRYEIAVLRETAGRGGSDLLHRIFQPGRKIFISKPINHFPLREEAERTLLFGGGIGVTPMLAFAHRLHALGRAFELHYSIRSRQSAGFLEKLSNVPWAENVHLHVSDEGSRADLSALLSGEMAGTHVYVCGPNAYMEAVQQAAEAARLPDDALHVEYFTPPEEPDYENHAFTLELSDGREIEVSADIAATDALLDAGIAVDVKCSDGLCGVCKCQVLDGEVEHRDFVLSARDRETHMILCKSRARDEGGRLRINLP